LGVDVADDAVQWLTDALGGADPIVTSDTKFGLTSYLARGRLGDAYVGAISGQASPSDQINALLDLLAWSLWEDEPKAPVTLVISYGPRLTTVAGALRTLRKNLATGRDITLMMQTEVGGDFTEDLMEPHGFEVDPDAARYAKLLDTWSTPQPDGIVLHLLEAADDDRLRLYPQLTRSPAAGWSVRLEGLQVGVVGSHGGWLDVGKTSAGGNNSLARSRWLSSGAPSQPFPVTKDTIETGAKLLKNYADALKVRATPGLAQQLLDHGQPEHALESAVLRGAIPVSIRGRRLDVPHADPLVIRDSQIPTRWAAGDGSARYIDALMRDGSDGWVLELKVPSAGKGYGSYLRKAISQAVLYRHFLASAVPAKGWLHAGGITRIAGAALAYPEITDDAVASKVRPRLDIHRGVAAEFGVEMFAVAAGPPIPAPD
jgi:hypothetical protein